MRKGEHWFPFRAFVYITIEKGANCEYSRKLLKTSYKIIYFNLFRYSVNVSQVGTHSRKCKISVAIYAIIQYNNSNI